VRCTYCRAPVSTRGNALTILAQWGTQHATNGRVLGTELLTGVVARDALLLYEDRSRLATLYLWLSQRFPDVYTNRDEVALLREQIDADILAALRERGEHGARARRPAKPAFHRKPVRYGPRPPSYGSGRRRR